MGQQTDPSDMAPFPSAPIEMDPVAADADDASVASVSPSRVASQHSHSSQLSPLDSPSPGHLRPHAPSSPPPLHPIITVEHERRASIAESGSGSLAAGFGPANSGSLPYRLTRSFREASIPLGFMTATAEMSSTVVAASTRSRSSTLRTRSSTVSDPDANNRALRQQRTPSKGQENALATMGMLDTLDEHGRPSHDAGDRRRSQSLTAAGGPACAPFPGYVDASDIGLGPSAAASTDSTKATVAEAETGTGETKAATAAVNVDTDAAAANKGREYQTGYHFPPRYTAKESMRHGLEAFWTYTKTPLGFLVVVYGLNVVAWGAMLFFMLLEATPAMCHPTCGDLNSPRRKWIEVDSQILNALFCLTGFGLAPWRFRDMFYWARSRWGHDLLSARRLAGIHRGWIRLPGSETLPVDVGPGNIPPETPVAFIPFPETAIPDAPLTGERAPPTKPWRIALVVLMNVANTLLQVVLSGFMWGMNRYDRPSWSTGLFIALGCVAGAVGGLGIFFEGKRVKGIEGVPLTDEDREKLASDQARGIYHYNNLKAKKPKAKNTDVEAQGSGGDA